MQEETHVHSDKRFINVRTGEVIEVTGTDAETSKVATVTATGRFIRPRTMKTTTLKTDYLNRRGTPWKSAFVALRVLPEDHPMAALSPVEPVAATAPGPDSYTAPDFSKMTNEEVSAYANNQRSTFKLHEAFFEKAQKELAHRHPETRPYLHGNVYVGISRNERFDAKQAKARLTDEEYASILVLKPDATTAKDVLPEARYKLTVKAHGNKVEVRPATENDQRKITEMEAERRLVTELEKMSVPEVEDPFASGAEEDPFAVADNPFLQ